MSDKIMCPNCGQSFDVEEALSGKIKAHLEEEYHQKHQKLAEKYAATKKELERERRQLQDEKTLQDEILKKELSNALERERKLMEQRAREAYGEQIKALQEENNQRKTENKALREKEVALMKKERQLREEQETLQLQMEKEILLRQQEIEEKARGKEREQFELEKAQLLKQIEDNKKLAEEMKRKAEQGSMQLQGEVQELALEALLSASFPFDRIREVPKGIRGADSIQTVVNALQQECGSIVYESKRTKNFANDWVDKLKQDQVNCKADIAVLVTETLPNDMDRFGAKDGVWICSFHEVKSVAFILREMLIKTHSAKVSQENKGDKMELLYRYLTSEEFVQQVQRIIENYSGMTLQLDKEKKAMMKIWAVREKQIWAVQENLSALFGSIKGIAGTELTTANILELPEVEEEEV